jgi:histone acetyltransferase (RNA polymerase elongator complex component)
MPESPANKNKLKIIELVARNQTAQEQAFNALLTMGIFNDVSIVDQTKDSKIYAVSFSTKDDAIMKETMNIMRIFGTSKVIESTED